jgi:Zn-dependent protease with chaperone function
MGFAKPFTIVVHSALFENFTDTELLFVIGHELAHIKRKHTVWLSLIAPFGRTLPVFDLIFNYWQRRCEFTCDRMGLLVCQDLSSAIQAMIKVGSGLHVLEHTDFGEFAKQATQAKGNILDSWPEMLNAHPYITNRISRLTEFFNTIRPADREAAANKDSRIILCQNEQCKAKLRIPFSTKNFIVTCPKCKESFRVTPEY